MTSSHDGEESNLDKLIEVIDSDPYAKKRKVLDSSQNDKENSQRSDLDDSEDEEQVEPSVEYTKDIIKSDLFDSFNEDYEKYISSNAPDESELEFNHPLFSPYTLPSPTPLLRYLSSLQEVPDLLSNLSEYFISNPLLKRVQSLSKNSRDKFELAHLPVSVKYLFSCLNTYVDVFYLNSRVSLLNEVRFVYSLHIANHVVKSSLKRKESKDDERSEGFTKPRVLVICGLRSIAKEIIDDLLKILPCSKSNKNLERFESDFSLPQEDLEDQKQGFMKTNRPKDFVKTFTGNQDDAFKIGLKYESGLLHLYSPFYSSDIIICSPLGMRPLISSKEPDYDFLSSIEVVVVDRLDLIKFQNWRLFTDLFKVVNSPLLKWRDGDISKIRMSVLDGQISEYRQTILVSCSKNIVFNSFFKTLKNRRGSIKLFRPCKSDYVLLASRFKMEQMFIKVPCDEVKRAQEDCLDYFMENTLPNLEEINGVLVVLQDYTQYFRLCKRLKRSNLEYLPCHESNTPKQIKIARQRFHAKEVPILVTTFRLLFFKRYLFKGTSKIFLIGPPEYSHIYKDFIRMVDRSRSNSIVCYYTKYHAMLLEPIVGPGKISKLVEASDTKITQFH